jgi:lysophospholipase L1-like esterase
VPRYTFPAGTVTNTTGAPLRLTFYVNSTTNRRETDLWTVDSSNNLVERIPNGVILTDATGAYSAFAGPDDIDTLYVNQHTGTSRTSVAATGPAAVAGRVFYASRIGEKLRRAARHAAGRNSLELPVMTSPPTITTNTSDPDSTVSVAYYFTVSAANAACYRYRGGSPLVASSIYYRFPTVTLPSSTGNVDATHNANGWAVEFMSDAPRVKVFAQNSTSTNGLMFEVDGQYVTNAVTAFPASSGGGYFLLDFTLGSVTFTDAGDLVTVSAAHGLSVGDAVMFGTITSTTGISANTTYYVKTVPSTTTLTLATTPSASTLALTTDGSSTSISKAATRRFRVEGDQASGMRGVLVPPSYTVWQPGETDPIVAAVVGDSNVAQTGVTKPNGGFAINLGKLLGWSDVREIGLGGTGWINQGAFASTFGDATRVADAVAANPTVLIVTGSTNDNASTAAAITAAVLAGLQAYRTALPRVPIIVAGVQPGASGPSASVLANEAAVKAAWTAWGDANSWFVDISNDTQGAWISGTGHQGATSGNGNSNVYVGTADTVHPGQVGHEYLGRRWAAAIRSNVLPNITV